MIFTYTALKFLREKYQPGDRVELISMNDPYNKTLKPGEKGTVVSVDDVGTIHVNWDCGSSLGLVFNVDSYRKISDLN